ncbi:MAG: 4-alpha-glucanotransferase [Oscillibacter sp.]|nr:4-alpha-glucanotransferase [Oscillibacter sp.]
MMMKRSAGILLPIFSLPSPYGIGSIGKEARAFADFLKEAGQTWWQILPVGPTGGGDSPYTTLSTFAGNPYFIDLDALAEEGLLTADELKAAKVPDGDKIDYGALYETRPALLRKAFSRITPETARAAREFRDKYGWVRDYTLYQALKERFGGKAWFDWPDQALRQHEHHAIEKWHRDLEPEIAYHTWEQYCFFRQWDALKQYVNGLGIKLIGDLPIYVSLDSSDVWAERSQFQLDAQGHPTKVAGVPPDYFSEDGQLWGNPLYDWNAMKQDGFGWWIRRVEGASRLFDAIRIDHFRAMESYWAVPADSKTAKNGEWVKGPGMDLLRVLTSWFHNVTYIAEDLGILTDAVHELRDNSGLPGMKVLEFAFSDASNSYLPHNYTNPNCICYTGTHDNDTLMGWCASVKKGEKAYAEKYLGVKGKEAMRQAVLRAGQSSVAVLFVAQMQDYLGLGTEARTNVPGVATGNWRWRMLPGAATEKVAEEIRELTETYGRCAPRPVEKPDKAAKKAAKAEAKAAKKAE